jgi:hypothetical protein
MGGGASTTNLTAVKSAGNGTKKNQTEIVSPRQQQPPSTDSPIKSPGQIEVNNNSPLNSPGNSIEKVISSSDAANNRCRGPDGSIKFNPTTSSNLLTAPDNKGQEIGYWYHDIGASLKAKSWRIMEVGNSNNKKLTGDLHPVRNNKKKQSAVQQIQTQTTVQK